ncbi:MAG: vWA domain-containing protein [Planctomycetota bacterium]
MRRRINPLPRRGAALVMLVLLLPVVLAIAAFVINAVYMELARTELQVSTDIATRAAGRMLAVTGDEQQAIDAANQMLGLNPYANTTISVNEMDIVFGSSVRDQSSERYLFTPDSENINAVSLRSFGIQDVPMIFPTFGVPMEFRPVKQAISTQVELDVAVVLDRSGSMASPLSTATASTGWSSGDPAPANSRWVEAVAAVQGFIAIMDESIHDEHMSLTTYATSAKKDVSLTNSYSSILAGMDAYTQEFDGGSTNIGDGLVEGGKSLSKGGARPWASRVLILLSDGSHTSGTDPIAAAQALANDKVMIYTISFSDEADHALLSEIAKIGTGSHYHTSNSGELSDVFRELARSLPTLITY